MKKSLLIAIAGLLALGSTAANAGGIYIGIGVPAPVYYAPPAPVYYAPPRPVYYAPRPVSYYAPAPVFVGRGWYNGRNYHNDRHRHHNRGHGRHGHGHRY